MANRTAREVANTGISFAETLSGGLLYWDPTLDFSDLPEVTTLETTDRIPVGTGTDGVTPGYMTLANLKVALGLPYTVCFVVVFPGRIEATTADNVARMQFRLKGVTGKTNTITGIGIIGSRVNPGATTGSTIVAVSIGDWNDSEDEIQASMAYGSSQTEIQVGSEVIAGDPPYFYLYCKQDADHNDVQVLVEVEIT